MLCTFLFLCSLTGAAIETCGGSDLSGTPRCAQTGAAIELCGGSDLRGVVDLRSQTVAAIEICGGHDLSLIDRDAGLACVLSGLLCYPLKVFLCTRTVFVTLCQALVYSERD